MNLPHFQVARRGDSRHLRIPRRALLPDALINCHLQGKSCPSWRSANSKSRTWWSPFPLQRSGARRLSTLYTACLPAPLYWRSFGHCIHIRYSTTCPCFSCIHRVFFCSHTILSCHINVQQCIACCLVVQNKFCFLENSCLTMIFFLGGSKILFLLQIEANTSKRLYKIYFLSWKTLASLRILFFFFFSGGLKIPFPLQVETNTSKGLRTERMGHWASCCKFS